jgi:hypothetical protein
MVQDSTGFSIIVLRSLDTYRRIGYCRLELESPEAQSCLLS